MRKAEGKSESPRAHFTTAQLPLLDAVRQAKTVSTNPVVRVLPVPALTDQNLLIRGNSGLNVGGVTEFDLSDPITDQDVVARE